MRDAIPNSIEPVQGKICIELINYPMLLFKDGATPMEYWAGRSRRLHESGTFVTFTRADADLFAQRPCMVPKSSASHQPESELFYNDDIKLKRRTVLVTTSTRGDLKR
ncbi:MAG: hypothetical protein K2W78_09145 [Xanthobacteraceae bacterium]|nr:hypothetical protein [Xanthobacteraceae bacterium]